MFSYIERGFYATQIARLITCYPRQQILVFRTDRLWAEPAATLASIEAFLGVEPRCGGDARRRYVAPVESRSTATLSVETRRALDAIFADDIVRTAELTGIDLSDWLGPDYLEPMHPGLA